MTRRSSPCGASPEPNSRADTQFYAPGASNILSPHDIQSQRNYAIHTLGISIPVPLASLNGCFGGLWTHAKCGRRLWLLSATRRPQEKREENERKRDQSRKQIHILIGQNLCLLGYGRAHWPVVCKCCLMAHCLKKICFWTPHQTTSTRSVCHFCHKISSLLGLLCKWHGSCYHAFTEADFS